MSADDEAQARAPALPTSQPASPGTPAAAESHKPTTFDWVRWVVAVAVAIAAALFFLNAGGEQSVCKHVLTGTNASSTTVDLCGPPRLLDLAPFVLVIAIVLWPDLHELRINGLITLTRRVREQERRQEAVESRLIALHQTVSQVAAIGQAQGQTQATTTTVNTYYAPDQEDVRRGIQEKERGEAPSAELTGAAPSPDGDSHTQLIGELLKEYARLEPYITVGTRPAARWAEDITRLSPSQRESVAEWNEMFRPEIQALRQARNVAVHEPQTVSVETLRGALQNTRELARILFGRLGLPPS